MQGQGFERRPQLPAILVLSDPDTSGADHWQALWEYDLPNCRRVEFSHKQHLLKRSVEQLEQAIATAGGPVVLVAHGMGCLAIAWWAKLKWRVFKRHQLAGAMFVAPPVGPTAPRPVVDFPELSPLPRQMLPFPSILVASRNDPNAGFQESEDLAECWGSQFIDAGWAGHLDGEARLGNWEQGIGLLESLLASVADADRSVRNRQHAIAASRATRKVEPSEEPAPDVWRRFMGPRKSNRMSDAERRYFEERAEAEIVLAQRAVHPGAVRSHYLLAGYYLDLVHCGGAVASEDPSDNLQEEYGSTSVPLTAHH